MKTYHLPLSILLGVIVAVILGCDQTNEWTQEGSGREEVVFWHFWGGEDAKVVEDVVARFNESQDRFWVRAIAMPGNNLDTKLFLSIAGEDPPDLVNQDDPIVADWAHRGIIEPFEQFASAASLQKLNESLLPSARALGEFNSKTYAVANGLDVRALLYNRTFLEQNQLDPPATLSDFDAVCRQISPPGNGRRDFYAYLPDSRRLWAWSYVFGGDIYDQSTGKLLIAKDSTVDAARWMQQFAAWYGPDNVTAFRQGDQSLPGKTFPLLPITDDSMTGRYIFILAGQWNTRDVSAFQQARREKQIPYPEFGVMPMPYPENGRANAGWVNGNVFVVPKGAKCKEGAWQFVQFWIGLNSPGPAAKTCARGGWIPVTESVVNDPGFQKYLDEHPLFAEYVKLATSPNQRPYPMVPGAPFMVRSLNAMNESLMSNPDKNVEATLESTQAKIQMELDRVRERYR